MAKVIPVMKAHRHGDAKTAEIQGNDSDYTMVNDGKTALFMRNTDVVDSVITLTAQQSSYSGSQADRVITVLAGSTKCVGAISLNNFTVGGVVKINSTITSGSMIFFAQSTEV